MKAVTIIFFLFCLFGYTLLSSPASSILKRRRKKGGGREESVKHESPMREAGKQNILIKFHSSSFNFCPFVLSASFNNYFAPVSYLHAAINFNEKDIYVYYVIFSITVCWMLSLLQRSTCVTCVLN